MAKSKQKRSVILTVLLVFSSLCVLGLAVSAVSNLFIPKSSPTQEVLINAQKARMAEATHLRENLGGQVWPGWDKAAIPLITYNESNAFLTGVDQPQADGWIKVPQEIQRGGAWQPMREDTFFDKTYYWQPLPESGKVPENFTVRVGDTWVASMVAKEAGNLELIQEFREQIPPFFRAVIPFQLAIRLFDSDWYISAVLHESFHAYQGQLAPDRLYAAELALIENESDYPFEVERAQIAWQAELAALQNALRAENDQQASSYAREFLTLRAQRRADLALSSELIEMERQREWLEGGAKYTELAIWQTAAENTQYVPIPETSSLPDFKNYQGFNGRWQNEVDQITRSANSGETMFYYSGMAQAFLLDRFSPDWKEAYFQPNTWLEDLLNAAID